MILIANYLSYGLLVRNLGKKDIRILYIQKYHLLLHSDRIIVVQ